MIVEDHQVVAEGLAALINDQDDMTVVPPTDQMLPEQERGVRQPQPDEEDDHAGKRAVGLVVGGEVRDKQCERG